MLTNSITGPPPGPVDGDADESADELDGTLTLFNASLYLLNIIVLFLVAITNEKKNLLKLKNKSQIEKKDCGSEFYW